VLSVDGDAGACFEAMDGNRESRDRTDGLAGLKRFCGEEAESAAGFRAVGEGFF
jgi:hypothetical protein